MSKPKINDKLLLSADVAIPSKSVFLQGELKVPRNAIGIALFAHGSGSSRFSQRNQYVAQVLREGGIGTLLFDLLTREEELKDEVSGHLRFDIALLAKRLVDATGYIKHDTGVSNLPVGYFGASTGGAAALMAAAELGSRVSAVVSRGGRPDLALPVLANVKAPTLLIVGGYDYVVIDLNEQAYNHLKCEKMLKIVPGATHLFEEAGALENVATLATEWFAKHFHSPAV